VNLRTSRRQLHGVVGALGLVAALLGFVGGLYPPGLTVAIALGIWILGATLVTLFTDR
jgi:hypothetical protein